MFGALTLILAGKSVLDGMESPLRRSRFDGQTVANVVFPTKINFGNQFVLMGIDATPDAESAGAQWAQILIARLAMYRSLRADTERKFGATHFRKWDDTYAFFVGLYGEGKLTGGRFIARKG